MPAADDEQQASLVLAPCFKNKISVFVSLPGSHPEAAEEWVPVSEWEGCSLQAWLLAIAATEKAECDPSYLVYIHHVFLLIIYIHHGAISKCTNFLLHHESNHIINVPTNSTREIKRHHVSRWPKSRRRTTRSHRRAKWSLGRL